MCLNHPELMHKHPAHLVSPAAMCLNHRKAMASWSVSGRTVSQVEAPISLLKLKL